MHPALVEEIVKVCRQREKDGDCPTVDLPGKETLEFTIIAIADQRDRMLEALRMVDGLHRAGLSMTGEAIEAVRRAIRASSMGTATCPICGIDKPHHHDLSSDVICPDCRGERRGPDGKLCKRCGGTAQIRRHELRQGETAPFEPSVTLPSSR